MLTMVMTRLLDGSSAKYSHKSVNIGVLCPYISRCAVRIVLGNNIPMWYNYTHVFEKLLI